MTPRERIVGTLLGQQVDHPPLVGWLGMLPWPSTLSRWRRESGILDLDIWRYFGFEPPCKLGTTPFATMAVAYGPCPPFEAQVLEKTPEFVIKRDYRGLLVRQACDENAMSEFMEHPIRSWADWDRYKADRLQLRLDERLAKLSGCLEAAQAKRAPIQVGDFPWGVFGTLRDMMGFEPALLAFYDEPELVRDIMDTYVTVWLELYEQVAQRVQIDHIHLWEDMAGRQGSLISMDMVEEFMMPHYDRVVEFARRHQIPLVSVDSDGKVDELLPVMVGHGINVFMPFEAQAGNDVERYGREYPTLGILGGLDKNALACDKDAMHRELDRAQRLFARGRFVVGFDHSIPPNVPWENFRHFMRQLRKIIGV